MKHDILIIGAGASGLMAAYGAARTLSESGLCAEVTILEKMPRPARKIMITGKGRCNFTNVKNWNEFQSHIRSKAQFAKTAFYNFDPEAVVDFFERNGMPTVIERGDRAFPQSYHASDVVDTLVRACQGYGVKMEVDAEVREIKKDQNGFTAITSNGVKHTCKALIIATGGLSYTGTGSTGDGYVFAREMGHNVEQTFPSLTALVPKGYKVTDSPDASAPELNGHIHRSTPLSELGEELCGIQLKNVGVQALVDGNIAQDEFGDIDFTDGGIEGPIGFQISRKCVKSIINGSKVQIIIDTKPGVELDELSARIKTLWEEIGRDRRSVGLKDKEKYRILLGKLLPWDLTQGFRLCNPDIVTLQRRGRTDTKVFINLSLLSQRLKEWRFDIEGFVGYERAVVTAGGVRLDEVVPKTMESRFCPGLYFCGEVLDIDSDTGGYNLQTAFSTGLLAGQSAARFFNQ